MQTVTVNINLALSQAQTQGFSTPAILSSDANFTVNRSKSYTSITDVAVDFLDTTKEYKAANAIFTQNPGVATIKFLRQDAGDASITAALNAVFQEDTGWYSLVILSRVKADILEVSAWAETNRRQFFALTEDIDVFDSAVTTDVISTIRSNLYSYTVPIYHHNGGVDSSTGIIGVILSEVVTVDDTAHGLRVGDSITTTLGADSATNGNHTVATVPTANQFTYVATGAIDDPAPADAIEYFARYTFFEAGLIGVTAWREVGSYTFKEKEVAGQVVTPTTIVTNGEIDTILGKGGNVYVNERAIPGLKNGTSGKPDLFADSRISADWLKDTMEAQIFTKLHNNDIPYNTDGAAIVDNEIVNVMDQALARNIWTPLSDTQTYIFVAPNPFDATSAQRAARALPPRTITALIGGFVHTVSITITLTV